MAKKKKPPTKSRENDAAEKVETVRVRYIAGPLEQEVVRVRFYEVPPRQVLYRVRVLPAETNSSQQTTKHDQFI